MQVGLTWPIELSVLSSQCINRRIEDEEQLKKEITAWENERNKRKVKINWNFTVEDARRKLKKVYPVTMNN